MRPRDVYEGRSHLGLPTGQTLIQVLAPGRSRRWGMFRREALSSFFYSLLEMFVNKVCILADVYDGGCYPGQSLIQALAPDRQKVGNV